MIRARAESVQFVGDENGWELHVHTNAADFVFNIHGLAWDLAAHANATIGAWRREGEAAQATAGRECAQQPCDTYPTNPVNTNYGFLGWLCDEHYAELEVILTDTSKTPLLEQEMNR